MSERSLFGMSGHFACMSYFLRRGYNVAVPVVDLGDDIIVIHEGVHEIRRVQVKSGNPLRRQRTAGLSVQEIRFTLSRSQLAETGDAELHYMLMAWVWERWSFILLSQDDLRARKVLSERRVRARGGVPRADGEARSDSLSLTISFTREIVTGDEDATLWGQSLASFLNNWSHAWPDLTRLETRPESHPNAVP